MAFCLNLSNKIAVQEFSDVVEKLGGKPFSFNSQELQEKYISSLSEKDKTAYFRAYYYWDKHAGRVSDIYSDIQGNDERNYSVDWKKLKEVPINYNQVVRVSQDIIPDLSEDEIIALSKMDTNEILEPGQQGKFRDGLIYLLQGDNGTINEVILRHEIFHKLWSQYLTEQQRSNMIRVVKATGWFKEYAILKDKAEKYFSDTEVEEFIAGLYQDYNLQGTKLKSDNKFVQFMYDIFEWLKHIATNLSKVFNSKKENELYEFFDRINKGQYNERYISNENVHLTMNFKEIQKAFPSIQYADSLNSYVESKEYIRRRFNHFTNKVNSQIKIGKDGAVLNVPLGINEIIRTIRNEVSNDIHNYFYEYGTERQKELYAKNENVAEIALSIQDPELRAKYYLFTRNDKGKFWVYDQVIDDLYTGFSIRDIEQATDDYAKEDKLNEDVLEARRNQQEEEFEDEVGNITDEVNDNRFVNHEKNLEDRLKLFIQNIGIYKDRPVIQSRGSVLDRLLGSRKAFVMLTTMLQDMNFDNKIFEHEFTKNEKLYDKEDLAVMGALYDVWNKSRMEGIDIPGNDKIKFDYTTGEFIIDGIRYNKRLKDSVNTISTSLYYQEMGKVVKGLPFYNDIKKKYGTTEKIYEYLKIIAERDINRDLWASIKFNIGSLIKENPVRASYDNTAIQINDVYIPNYVYKLVNITPASVTTAIRDNVNTALGDVILNSEIRQSILDLFYEQKGTIKANKNNINYEKSFDILMKYLELPYISDNYSRIDIMTMMEGIKWIVTDTKPTIKENDDSVYDRIMQEKKGYLTKIANILSKRNALISTQNYIDPSGNKRYLHVIGSWIYDLMNGVINKNLPAYLREDNYISRNNPFAKGKGIYEFSSVHDLSKDNSTLSPKKLQNLEPFDVYVMKFLNGFYSQLSLGNKRMNISTQTQSNRNVWNNIQVDVQDEVGLINYIEAAKKVEQDRQDAMMSEKFNVKNFNKEVVENGLINNVFLGKTNKEILEQIDKYSWNDFKEFLSLRSPYYKFNALDRQNDKVLKTLKKNNILSKQDISRIEELYNQDELKEYNITDIEKKILPEVFKAWNIFYRNNYIQGFHLDMLVFGDSQLAKNEEDYTKRMQGVQSPRKTFAIGDEYVRAIHKYLVLKDSHRMHDIVSDVTKIYGKIYNKNSVNTDAATWILPETIEEFIKGSGDKLIDNIVKNIVFYVDKDGITRYIKTASFVLTDTLCNMYPELAMLRDKMRKGDSNGNRIDHAIFESAYKVGQPLTALEIDDEFTDDKIHDLDMRYYGLQFNPIHDNSLVSNTSQFNYFLNVNGLNTEQTGQVYDIDAKLMSLNWEAYNAKYKILSTSKDGEYIVDKDNLRKALKDVISETDHRLLEILESDISFNYPALVKRLTSQVTALVGNNSVKIKQEGGKEILRPSFGVSMFEKDGNLTSYDKLSDEEKTRADKYYKFNGSIREALSDISDIFSREKTVQSDGTIISGKEYLDLYYKELPSYKKLKDSDKAIVDDVVHDLKIGNDSYYLPRRLRMRDENGFTEVVVSRKFADKYNLKLGDIIASPEYKKLLETGLAVRIPTTGLHSSLAIKIVAVSDNTNFIIAPEELVILHGSDFDIDALFVMRREVVKKDNEKYNVKKGYLVGYKLDGTWDSAFESMINKESYEGMTNAEIDELKHLKSAIYKNKKLDILIEIITADRNKQDMNTPIDFAPIKQDIFDGITRLDYANDLSEGKVKDFASWFKSKIDNNSVQGLDMTMSEQEIKDFYKGFGKDKLVLPEKLQNAILDSNVGVVTKMKVVTGNLELRKKKNLRKVSDQVQTHKDNFEGKMGVGMQANVMKSCAYILYANGNKEAKIYHINKDQQKVVRGYKYDGYVFDSIVPLTKKYGLKTFELGDTLINGYIDNVKEMVTWILNATSATIRTIGYMVNVGMDMDSMTYILNQPAIKHVGTSILTYNQKLSETMNSMIKKYYGSGYDVKSKMKFFSEEHEIGDTEMIDILKNFYNKDINTFINTATKKQLEAQIVALDMFDQMRNDSAQFSKLNNVLKCLQELPNTFEDIQKVLKNVDFVQSEDFSFGTKDVTEIPHIKEAIEHVRRQEAILKDTFNIYKDKVSKVITDVIKNTGINAKGFLKKWGYDSIETEAFVRQELQYFVVTKWIEQKLNDGIIPTTEYTAIRNNDGALLTSKEVTDNKDVVTGVSELGVWKQQFANRIMKYRSLLKEGENYFLQFFALPKDVRGIYDIKFSGGTNIDPNLEYAVQKGYESLPADMRRDFLIYSVLTDKSNSAFRSFSKYIKPLTSTVTEDGINVVDDFNNNTWDELLDNDGEKLKNISEEFAIQLIQNNTEYVKFLLEPGLNTENKIKLLPVVGIDAKEHNKYMILPEYANKYIVEQGFIYRKSDKYVEFVGKTYNVYEQVAIMPVYPSYIYNRQYEQEERLAVDMIKVDSDVFNKISSLKENESYSVEKKVQRSIYDIPELPQRQRVIIDKESGKKINAEYKRTSEEVIKKEDEDFGHLSINKTEKIKGEEVLTTTRVPYKKFIIQDIYSNPTIVMEQKVAQGNIISKNELEVVLDKITKLSKIKYVLDAKQFIDAVNKSKGYRVNENEYPAGVIVNDVVYINTTGKGNGYRADTPIHEIAHIYIEYIKKNYPLLYDNLVNEMKNDKEGQRILSLVGRDYKNYNTEEKEKEALVTFIGLEGAKKIQPKGVLQKLFTRLKNIIKKFLEKLKLRTDNIDNYTIGDIVNHIVSGKMTMNETGHVENEFSIKSYMDDDIRKYDDKSDVFVNIHNQDELIDAHSFNNYILNPNAKEGVTDIVAHNIKNGWNRAKNLRQIEQRQNNVTNEMEEVWVIRDNKGNIKETMNFEQYSKKRNNEVERKLQRGVIFRKYMEYKISNNPGILEDFNSLIAGSYYSAKEKQDIREEAETYWTTVLDNKVLGALDVMTNVPVSITGMNIDFKDNNGIEHKTTGIAKKVNIVIEHSKDVFSVIDLMTGFMPEDMSGEKMMEYAKKAGVEIKFNSTTMGKMNLALSVLMMKASNKEATFQEISLYGPRESGKENWSEPLMTNYQSEFDSYLKLLSQYFRDTHNAWYNKNKELFISENYVAKLKDDNAEGIKKSTATRYQQFKDGLDANMVRLQQLQDTMLNGIPLDKDREEYRYLMALISQKMTGTNIFAAGNKKHLNYAESLFMGHQEYDSPLTDTIKQLFSKGNYAFIEENQKEFNKIKRMTQKVVTKPTFHVGAKYKDMYSFMWKDHDPTERGLEGEYMRTYLDNDWMDITDQQRELLDNYRWLIRYHMFATMDPQQGIRFIKTELSERTNLSEENKKLLEDQIEELNKLPNFSKFEYVGKEHFKYFEGWMPRQAKDIREEDNPLVYVGNWMSSVFSLTEDEFTFIKKQDSENHYVGLPVRHFGEYGKNGIKQREGKLTYNGEALINLFVMNMIRKRNLDAVACYAKAILNHLQIDTRDNSLGKRNDVRAIQGMLHVTINKTKQEQIGSVKIPWIKDKEGVNKVINVDRTLLGFKSLFGASALALRLLSPQRTGTGQAIVLNMRACSWSLTQWLFPKSVREENVMYDYSTYSIAHKDYLSMIGKGAYGRIANTEGATKMNMFNSLIGNTVGSYDYKLFNKNKLATSMGYLTSKQLNTDALFFMYQLWDVYTYSVTMGAMLRKMKTTKNGKEISMWDAYEIIDNELVYTGDDRGINKSTGEIIRGLTSEDKDRIKKQSRDLFGGMREDEKASIEAGLWGILYMQFKHYYPALINNAWKGKFENELIGHWHKSTTWEVVDHTSDYYMEKVELDSPRYNELVSKNVRMLPQLEWMKEVDEGYIRTLMHATGWTVAYMVNPVKAKEYFNSLSDYQKANIIYALMKLSMYFAFGMVLAAAFGGDLDENDNKWLRQLSMLRKDLAFETLVLDVKGNWRTITQVPTAEQIAKLCGGLYKVGGSIITGHKVTRGEHKGEYVGQGVWKYIPVVNTVGDAWSTFSDYQTIGEGIQKEWDKQNAARSR